MQGYHDTSETVRQRAEMVCEQLRGRGIGDAAVLAAMETVPRHLFVPEPLRGFAYDDRPLPLRAGQTISQPYVVAYMASALLLGGSERILDVGTGSGYQAAVLSCIAAQVYTIERRLDLLQQARATFHRLGYRSIRTRHADGREGWPEEAPFDAILVAAVAAQPPPALVDQLAEGGRLLMPIDSRREGERLIRLTREGSRLRTEALLPVRFVPLRKGLA